MAATARKRQVRESGDGRALRSADAHPRAGTRAGAAAKRAGTTRVRGTAAPAKRATRTPRRRGAARASSTFNTVLLVMVVLAGLALGRVAIVARAAEVTMSADKLLGDIAAERVESGRLEVDKSSLSTPSRLESIAGATMGMGKPRSVRYLRVPTEVVTGEPAASRKAGSARRSGLVDALIDMTAGEAQTLLLGDMGLAGAR